MPITIDLLAEGRDEEESRKKSPVKLALWISGFVILLVFLWIAKLAVDIHFAQAAYDDTRNRSNEAYIPFAAATNNIIKIAQIDRKLAALERLATNRFLWAPLLSTLQKTVIDGIRVTRVAGKQSYTAEAPRTIGSGPDAQTTPGCVIESFALSIQGWDTSDDEQACIAYKQKLDETPYFFDQLRRSNGFVLQGILHPGATNELVRARGKANFALDSQFPEVRRGE